MKHHISLIPERLLSPEIIDRAIELMRPAIEETGRYTTGSVTGDIISGRHHLWLILSERVLKEQAIGDFNLETGVVAAFTTCFELYPTKKMLRWCFLGGTGMDDWGKDAHQILMDFAKANACDGMEVSGRRGWKRFLKSFGGWKADTVICEMFFPLADPKEKRDEMAA